MKFVALALALVLAVGSQAASLQADAPSQLEHIRAAMDVYINQIKGGANRALDQLDDTEYAQIKASINQRLDEMHAQIKALQGVVSPITDTIVNGFSEATAEFRASFAADMDALKADIEPKREELKRVVDRHIAEYRTQLEPIITEYYNKHTKDMEALRVRLEPIAADLRTKVETNVEETKAALMPIVESVREKLTAHLESLKAMASPYVEEYKDKLVQSYSQVSTNTEDYAALRETIAPLAAEIKVNLHKIFEAIASTVTKS